MLELRLLGDGDVPLVEGWLNKSHVKRWYDVPGVCSIDDWMMEINGRHAAYQWLTHLMLLWQGRPIGFCQYYKCEDSGEDLGTLPQRGSYAIDYLIGEEAYLGKGFGKGTIALLVDKIFALPDAQRVVADPDGNNTASQNALLSNGFALFDAERCLYVLEKDKRTEKYQK